MKAIIVDDDSRVANIITKLIETDFDDIVVVASAEDIETGIRCIKEHKPDLLFLDINLPDGTGFDLLKNLGHIDFKIIFITAFENTPGIDKFAQHLCQLGFERFSAR